MGSLALKIGVTSAVFHCSGIVDDSIDLLNMVVSKLTMALPPSLINRLVKPSGPGAELFFSWAMVHLTSCSVIIGCGSIGMLKGRGFVLWGVGWIGAGGCLGNRVSGGLT